MKGAHIDCEGVPIDVKGRIGPRCHQTYQISIRTCNGMQWERFVRYLLWLAHNGTRCTPNITRINQNGQWVAISIHLLYLTRPHRAQCSPNLANIDQNGQWETVCSLFATVGWPNGPRCVPNPSNINKNVHWGAMCSLCATLTWRIVFWMALRNQLLSIKIGSKRGAPLPNQFPSTFT